MAVAVPDRYRFLGRADRLGRDLHAVGFARNEGACSHPPGSGPGSTWQSSTSGSDASDFVLLSLVFGSTAIL